MSAYIVDKSVIDRIVNAASRATHAALGGYPLHFGDCQYPALGSTSLGRILWLENLASVKARYPKDRNGHRMGPRGLRDEEIARYEHAAPLTPPTIVEALRLLDGYEYQSCEHDEWPTSTACLFVDALRRRLITMLPGYDEAPWAE